MTWAVATGAALIVVAGNFPTLAAVVSALVVSEFILRYIAAERAHTEKVMALTRARATLLEQALGAEERERAWLAGHVRRVTLTAAREGDRIRLIVQGDGTGVAPGRPMRPGTSAC